MLLHCLPKAAASPLQHSSRHHHTQHPELDNPTLRRSPPWHISQYPAISSAMNPSTIASRPELFAVWTLVCQMTHDCFKSHICFSSFVVLSLAQTQRSVPNVHSQTEPNQGAPHLRCAPGYRHNDITVLIIGDENNRVILCPQSSLKFSHTQPKISFILFLHSP